MCVNAYICHDLFEHSFNAALLLLCEHSLTVRRLASRTQCSYTAANCVYIFMIATGSTADGVFVRMRFFV